MIDAKYKETLRLAHYESLVRLAEHFGFAREDVGVSLGKQQPGEENKGNYIVNSLGDK